MLEESKLKMMRASVGWYTISDDLKKSPCKMVSMEEFVKMLNDGRAFINDQVVVSDGKIVLEEYFPECEEKGAMPPYGIYETKVYKGFFILSKAEIYSDKYIDLGNKVCDEILADISSFTDKKTIEAYKKHKLLHKRGYLLHGKSGNGKTMIINHVIEKYKDKARIIFISSWTHLHNLIDFRGFFKDDLTIFIFEELCTYISSDNSSPNDFLLFLDGQNSWDNAIFLATTNYPELIPGNIINRPSRFDKVIEINNPTMDVRKCYLESVFNSDGISITDEILKLTEGLSIAHLKEICIQVKIRGKSFKEVFLEMEDTKKKIKEHFKEPDEKNAEDMFK